jgi:hypothetical protein
MFTNDDVLFSFEVNIVVVVLYSMFSQPWKTKILECLELEESGGIFINLKFFDAIDELLLVDDGYLACVLPKVAFHIASHSCRRG